MTNANDGGRAGEFKARIEALSSADKAVIATRPGRDPEAARIWRQLGVPEIKTAAEFEAECAEMGIGMSPKAEAVRVRLAKENAEAEMRSPPRFKLARFDEITPTAGAGYLVKGLLPRAGLAVIWGAPKCGKSFWTFDLLMHVALGWEYRGHRVKAGAVIYCALEGAQGFKNRVEAFRQAKLAESADAAVPFFLMATPLSLVADQAQLVADICAQVGDAKPVSVCIDTLNRSIAGSENDDKDMGAYVRAADAIRAAFDCLVVIVHHSGYSAERPRGHSSLVGALDVQISVKSDAADNIVTELELAKDEAIGLQFVSRLKVVEIGRDDDGDPITSCVVEAADETDKPAAKKATAKVQSRLPKSAVNALRALDETLAEVGVAAPASNHIPPSARVVTVKEWRTYAFQMGISSSRPDTSEANQERARLKAFDKAVETLAAESEIAIWGTHVWKTG